MKSYEEMAKDVFNRIDEFEEERRRKKSKVTKAVAAVTPVCAAAVVGVGLWTGGLLTLSHNQLIDSESEAMLPNTDIIVSENTAASLEDKNVLADDRNDEKSSTTTSTCVDSSAVQHTEGKNVSDNVTEDTISQKDVTASTAISGNTDSHIENSSVVSNEIVHEKVVHSNTTEESNDIEGTTQTDSSTTRDINIVDSNAAEYASPNNQIEPTENNSVVSSGEPITVSGGNGMALLIASINVDGFDFVEVSEATGYTFTADQYIGTVGQFTGTYSPNYNSSIDSTSKIFTVKENKYILIVINSNGETIVLSRMGNIVVNGRTYFETQIDASTYSAERIIGKANDFEIIITPFNRTYLTGDEEIFTVKENDEFLIFKSSDGEMKVFAIA